MKMMMIRLMSQKKKKVFQKDLNEKGDENKDDGEDGE